MKFVMGSTKIKLVGFSGLEVSDLTKSVPDPSHCMVQNFVG